MIRQIIRIDENKCDGCGICVTACHEGAIDIVEGKAKLVREHFCDGLGDCLPSCPQGAISFEKREAPEYDEEAVKQMQMEKERTLQKGHDFPTVREMTVINSAPSSRNENIECERKSGEGNIGSQENVADGRCRKNVEDGGFGSGVRTEPMRMQMSGCAGARFMQFERREEGIQAQYGQENTVSELGQWPCQIKLVPVKAPFFRGARLLIAADCTAFAYANLHREFMKGKITIIGCPKLDEGDYTEKLTQIITENDIKSVTVVRMEVPCCGGIQRAAENALKNSGKFIPWRIVTVTRDGRVSDI